MYLHRFPQDRGPPVPSPQSLAMLVNFNENYSVSQKNTRPEVF